MGRISLSLSATSHSLLAALGDPRGSSAWPLRELIHRSVCLTTDGVAPFKFRHLVLEPGCLTMCRPMYLKEFYKMTFIYLLSRRR